MLPNGQYISYIHSNPITHKTHKNIIRHEHTQQQDNHKSNSNKNKNNHDTNCGIFFLPGFQSKKRSTKAKAIFEYCQQSNIEFTTLDYYGHGESSFGPDSLIDESRSSYEENNSNNGINRDDIEQYSHEYYMRQGTISRWIHDFFIIFNHVSTSPKQILVGSSMGAWIMIVSTLYNTAENAVNSFNGDVNLCVSNANTNANTTPTSSIISAPYKSNKQITKQIKGLIGIASAPDFTKLIQEQIHHHDKSKSLKDQMHEFGYCDIPTKYDNDSGVYSYRIYEELLRDAEQYYLLSESTLSDQEQQLQQSPPLQQSQLQYSIPVTLIHGLKDEDVPWRHSEQLLQILDASCCKPKKLVLVENGDHRLSSVDDIAIILNEIDEMF